APRIRSRSITTAFIAPGGSSAALITATNPSGIRATRLVQREPEKPRGVLRRDLARVLLRGARADAIQELLRPRPRGLGVREVAPPQHVVDADRVAELHPEVVLHELDEHVAP